MSANKPACTVRHYEISERDLPLSCPLPQDRLWDAHPRVYLAIEKVGRIACPYCETEYVLIDPHSP